MKGFSKFLVILIILSGLAVGVYWLFVRDEDLDVVNEEETTSQESEESEDTETPEPEESDEMEDETEGYMDVSPQEAYDLIQERDELVVLDVSSAYEDGHLPGAINYYVGDGSLEEAIPELDPNLPYLVYCHVTSAAVQGAQMLVDAGFETVYRMEGNYSGWVEAELPTEN